MHNNLAWAVLGVEPSTTEAIEGAAKQQGIPIGQFLERLMAEAQNAAAEKAAATQASQKRNQRLSDLISSMADSLMAAADVVEEGTSARVGEASAPEYAKAEALENKVQIAVPSKDTKPPMLVAEQDVASGPTPEQLQAWIRAERENSSQPKSPTKMFGRALLRLSA